MIVRKGLFNQFSRYLNTSKKILQLFSSSILIDKHEYVEVFFSDSNDIHYNLSLEQLLYEKDLKVPRLMLWKNNDAVIIGKYQNQWQECNMFNLNEDQVPLVRRKTGGGTVYHDMGNICFSFITPIYSKDIYPLDPRQYNVQILQNAMKNIGIETGLTARKDLTINSMKISGSAYQANMPNKYGEGKKCLHHGTILVNANLNRLWRYLKPKEKQIKSKAQESVVSQVCNIKDIYPNVQEDIIYQSIIHSFTNFFNVQNCITKHFEYKTMINEPFIQQQIDEFKSWDWMYGKTPKFQNEITIPISHGEVKISLEQQDGFVSKMEFQFDDHLFYFAEQQLNDHFSNQKIPYGIQEVQTSILENVIGSDSNLSSYECDIIKNEVLPALSHLL